MKINIVVIWAVMLGIALWAIPARAIAVVSNVSTPASSAVKLDNADKDKKDNKAKDDAKDGDEPADAEMKDAVEEEEEDLLGDEIRSLSTRDIVARRRLLENDLRIMKSEFQRLSHEKSNMNDKIKDNQDKIENNRY